MPNTTNQNNSSKVSKSLMNSPYMQNYSEHNSHSNAGGQRQPRQGYVPRATAPMAAAYPQGMPSMPGRPVAPQQRNAVMMGSPIAVGVPATGQSARKKKKQMKKMLKGRSDHFYIQRKGSTFLMMLVSLLLIAVVAISALGILPMLGGVTKKPDYTAEDKRLPTKVDGVEVPYEDKSIFYSPMDSLMGMIKQITKNDLYAEKKAAIDEEIKGSKLTEVEIEELYKSIEIYKSEFYDSVLLQFEKNQTEGIIPMLFMYSPAFFILIILILLLTVLKCLGSFGGKRVFKRFGLTGLLVIVLGVGMLFSGFIGADALTNNTLGGGLEEEVPAKKGQSIAIYDDINNIENAISHLGEQSIINLATEEEEVAEPTMIEDLMAYITGAFSSYPETTEADVTFPKYVSGFLPLIVIAVGVLILLFSFFARKKISYSIFESIK